MFGKISRLALVFVLAVVLAALAACQQKYEQSQSKPVRISATKAYEKYFGPAPTTDKGTCYAFVIYFPSARVPGKVTPFPFFTFDEASVRKVAVERLIGGMEAGSYKGEFLQPFPPGTSLLGMTEQGGTVTVNFAGEAGKWNTASPSGQAALDGLVLTLAQFGGVREIRVQVGGQALQKPVPGGESRIFIPEETAVMEPGAPRLLSVTAVKDKGATGVEDVSIYFDRPVEIRELQLTDKEGKAFGGEVYHSVFDMAAVLKPKEPAVFTTGMPVKVRWQVMDKVGRTGSGDGERLLEVREH